LIVTLKVLSTIITILTFIGSIALLADTDFIQTDKTCSDAAALARVTLMRGGTGEYQTG